jgi:tetratricopeptide (TPR) repeat protein
MIGFQKFLRMASVIGGKFWDTDVFYLIGDSWMTTDDIVIYDLYGFLTTSLAKGGEKRLCSFTSTQIQDCIYQMISFDHRNKMHKEIATYFEGLYKRENDDAILIPIIRNYEACHSEEKTYEYLNLACQNLYDKRQWPDVIEYHHKLLKIIRNRQLSNNDKEQLANCHYILGEAYFATSRFDDAERYIFQALKILDYELAKTRVSISLQRVQNTLVSVRSRSRSFATQGSMHPNTRKDKVRTYLLLLARVHFFRENRTQCKASTVSCLDLCSKYFGRDGCYAEANALRGLLHAEHKKKTALSLVHIQMSEDILQTVPKGRYSLSCMFYAGLTHFFLGSWSKAIEYYQQYTQQFDSTVNHDVEKRSMVCSLILLNYYRGKYKTCAELSTEMASLCTRTKDDYGQWVFACTTLLGRLVDFTTHHSSIMQLTRAIQSMEAVPEKLGTPGMQLLCYGLLMESNLRANSSADVWNILRQGIKALSKVTSCSYMSLPGIERFCSAMFIAYDTQTFTNDEGAKKAALEFLELALKTLQSFERLKIYSVLQVITKGLMFLLNGKQVDAVKLWEKSIFADDAAGDLKHLEAFLFAKLYKYHSDPSKQEANKAKLQSLCEEMNVRFESLAS